MPTYQYSCTECGHFFEVFQSFSDDSLTVCPECSGVLRKVFNAVGVVFKGSGFYRNDSRGKHSSEAPSSSGSNGSSSTGSGSSGSSGDSSSSATTSASSSASSSSPSASTGGSGTSA